MNMTYKLTTIINKEGRWYVARCVELGVVSQGKTIEQAQKNLKEAVELYLEDQPKTKMALPEKDRAKKNYYHCSASQRISVGHTKRNLGVGYSK